MLIDWVGNFKSMTKFCMFQDYTDNKWIWPNMIKILIILLTFWKIKKMCYLNWNKKSTFFLRPPNFHQFFFLFLWNSTSRATVGSLCLTKNELPRGWGGDAKPSHVVTCDVDTTLATSQFYQCFMMGDLKMFRTCSLFFFGHIVFEIHWLKLKSDIFWPNHIIYQVSLA